MTLALVPFPVDLSASLDLAEQALRVRLAPGEQLTDFLPRVTSAIRTGQLGGGLLRDGGSTRGIVTWEPAGPLGVGLRLIYLGEPYADVPAYQDALATAEKAAGPIVFAPGPLAGLSESEEAEFFRQRGYAPFGRSEMALPPSTPTPAVPAPEGITLRALRPTDEPALARLHERAYEDHLDRFLALEDLDPERDAARQLRDYFSGRYGEVLAPGSSVGTVGDEVVAAAISTHYPATNAALIIDVMTAPDRQGSGVGRAVLSHAVRSLRERGESRILLNVTEGNGPAFRLYTGLGFVRTMGPTREWYNARRIHVRFPNRDAR